MRPTGEAVEQLCGCRSVRGPGTDILHRCREAKQLLAATEGHDPLDFRDPAWGAYYEHYADADNPVVRAQGRDGVWVEL